MVIVNLKMFHTTSTPVTKRTRGMEQSMMNEMSPFRLEQLPFDLDDLSLSSTDVYQMLTPKQKGMRPLPVDEDSGLGMETFDTIQEEYTDQDLSFDIAKQITDTPCSRRSLFGLQKRHRRDSKGSPLTKRRKHVTSSRKRIQKSLSFGDCPRKSPPTDQSEVLQFVERVTQEEDLVGDGSATHSLPTIPGKHADLKSVTNETVSKLVNGEFDDVIGSYQIIDCRYPYEYEAGHVKNALNLYKESDAETILSFKENQGDNEGKRHILIFYCEFSSERGPKMYRNVRKADRAMNQDQYPKLNFPEMYLMHNGYKCFFENQKRFCEPEDYKPMLHKEHAQDLRHFRAKSKSFAAGEKRKKASRLSF
ncbi:M-phase inducer phosphatase-like [Saccostrea echinata]|uniref:M-phase inducer phosphatase-like n=1 Tax=Saccostrea echinata TaxID=191078 RepID=UPI002A7FE42B|nr:M-phase inducer phosphatase-like [Saccostrea echinata]